MLLGICRPSSGTASLLGRDISNAAQCSKSRAQVAYVAEDKQTYGYLTVAEMIAFTRSFYSDWSVDLEGHFQKQFERPPQRNVKALSKGMRTKLALLLALARRPKLLVLDEPSEGLDPVSIEELLQGLVAAAADSTTAVTSKKGTRFARRLFRPAAIKSPEDIHACANAESPAGVRGMRVADTSEFLPQHSDKTASRSNRTTRNCWLLLNVGHDIAKPTGNILFLLAYWGDIMKRPFGGFDALGARNNPGSEVLRCKATPSGRKIAVGIEGLIKNLHSGCQNPRFRCKVSARRDSVQKPELCKD
jgi:ABC-type polar amino acid transport system ATPase subunit